MFTSYSLCGQWVQLIASFRASVALFRVFSLNPRSVGCSMPQHQFASELITLNCCFATPYLPFNGRITQARQACKASLCPVPVRETSTHPCLDLTLRDIAGRSRNVLESGPCAPPVSASDNRVCMVPSRLISLPVMIPQRGRCRPRARSGGGSAH